ncbi:hypothetical protein AABB24_007652, partial [Solanum stoloniferum]
ILSPSQQISRLPSALISIFSGENSSPPAGGSRPSLALASSPFPPLSSSSSSEAAALRLFSSLLFPAKAVAAPATASNTGSSSQHRQQPAQAKLWSAARGTTAASEAELRRNLSLLRTDLYRSVQVRF